MDAVASFAVTFGLAAIVYALVRLVAGRRGERALNRLADRAAPGAVESRILMDLGSAQPAREAGFETRRHRATLGVKAIAGILAVLLFHVTNTTLLASHDGAIGAGEAQWLGLGALALLGWYLLWLFTYAVEVGRDSIRVPTLAVARRSLRLDGLIAVEDADPHFLRLRFRDGRRAQVLKYLTGRAELEAALARWVSQNTERAGGECRNSPRSRRSAAGSSRS
jgi:hypothetical protein